MSNELIPERNWWQQNRKWFFPALVVSIALFILLFKSGSRKYVADFAQGYTEKSLYESALKKAQANERVKTVLGALESINKLAILEGEIKYTNNNNSVFFSLKINGKNGKGMMDVSADKIDNQWNYKSIKVRIKNPPEKKETIIVLE